MAFDSLKKCLSSSDEVSFGRTMSGIAFLACMLWDTFFVGFAAHKLNFVAMKITDILPSSDTLKGQAEACALFYGITKVGDVVKLVKGNG